MCLVYGNAIIMPFFYNHLKWVPKAWTGPYLTYQKVLIACGIVVNFLRDDVERRARAKQVAKSTIKRSNSVHGEDQFTPGLAILKFSVSMYLSE